MSDKRKLGLWSGLAILLIGLTWIAGRWAGIPVVAQPSGLPPPVDDWAQTAHTVTLPLVTNRYWIARDLIAFERQLDNGNHDIFLMRDDGSAVRNLTDTADADDGAPAWSPDGRFLAFSSDRVGGERRAIFKMDLITGEITRLTGGEHRDRWPTWSPAGDRIAFMREIPTGLSNPLFYPADIYVMDADGSNVRQLTDATYGDNFPAWSPDGEWIAYSATVFYDGQSRARPDLWLVRPDGSDKHVILRTDPPQPPDGHDKDRRDEIYPTWSPDGQWIYHTFKYRDYPADAAEWLYRIRPDGTERQRVFDDEYNRYIASFAPDGTCFVFYSYMGQGDKDVWRWCDGDTQPLNLTDNDGISDEFCAWSPVP